MQPKKAAERPGENCAQWPYIFRATCRWQTNHRYQCGRGVVQWVQGSEYRVAAGTCLLSLRTEREQAVLR